MNNSQLIYNEVLTDERIETDSGYYWGSFNKFELDKQHKFSIPISEEIIPDPKFKYNENMKKDTIFKSNENNKESKFPQFPESCSQNIFPHKPNKEKKMYKNGKNNQISEIKMDSRTSKPQPKPTLHTFLSKLNLNSSKPSKSPGSKKSSKQKEKNNVIDLSNSNDEMSEEELKVLKQIEKEEKKIQKKVIVSDSHSLSMDSVDTDEDDNNLGNNLRLMKHEQNVKPNKGRDVKPKSFQDLESQFDTHNSESSEYSDKGGEEDDDDDAGDDSSDEDNKKLKIINKPPININLTHDDNKIEVKRKINEESQYFFDFATEDEDKDDEDKKEEKKKSQNSFEVIDDDDDDEDDNNIVRSQHSQDKINDKINDKIKDKSKDKSEDEDEEELFEVKNNKKLIEDKQIILKDDNKELDIIKNNNIVDGDDTTTTTDLNELIIKLVEIFDINDNISWVTKNLDGQNPYREHHIKIIKDYAVICANATAILLDQNETGKVFQKFILVHLTAPLPKFEIINNERIVNQLSLENYNNHISDGYFKLHNKYLTNRNQEKGNDLIFKKIKEQIGEFYNLKNQNYRSCIKNLLAHADKTIDPDDFTLATFTYFSRYLDFATPIVEKKFTNDDLLQSFPNTKQPICIVSGLVILIGEDVKVFPLILQDAERNNDWQLTKLPETPYKKEALLKSLKFFYVKTKAEIDLSTEDFHLFDMATNKLAKKNENLEPKPPPTTTMEKTITVTPINKETINNTKKSNKTIKTSTSKKNENGKKKSTGNKKPISEKKEKEKKEKKEKEDKKSNGSKQTEKKSKKRSLEEDTSNEVQKSKKTKLNPVNNSKSKEKSKLNSLKDLISNSNNNKKIEDENDMKMEVDNNGLLNDIINIISPKNILIELNSKYTLNISSFFNIINSIARIESKINQPNVRKTNTYEIDFSKIKNEKQLAQNIEKYCNNLKNKYKGENSQTINTSNITFGIFEFIKMFLDLKIKNDNKSDIKIINNEILSEKTKFSLNKNTLVIDTFFSVFNDKPFQSQIKNNLNSNKELTCYLEDITFFKIHKKMLMELFVFLFYDDKK